MSFSDSAEGVAAGRAVPGVQGEALQAADPSGAPGPSGWAPGSEAGSEAAPGSTAPAGDAAADPAPTAAAACEAAAGPAQAAEPPWQRFRRERAARLARHDTLGAAIFLAVLAAARYRAGDMPSLAEVLREAHGLALVFLSSAVMMWGQDLAESGWGSMRTLLVLALKFEAITCPLFRLYSQAVLNEYPKVAGLPAVLGALLRAAVADHTGLLLLMGTILPQHIVADAICQCLFFIFLSTQTEAFCNTPYIQVALKTMKRSPPLGTMRGCVTYISTSQLWVGVVLPLLLSVRRESAAAARFEEENGVPPTDRRRRAYTWLHRATTVGTPASAVLAAGLVGAYAVWAAAAWAYLGRVYG